MPLFLLWSSPSPPCKLLDRQRLLQKTIQSVKKLYTVKHWFCLNFPWSAITNPSIKIQEGDPMSWAPIYAFYFQLQIAFFLSSLACNNNFFSSFLFFQIVVCKLQLQLSKTIVARESGKFMQHRLRIWLLESLTKILVASWKKGLFIFHFISTLEDFVFGFFWIWYGRSAVLKNLTYKHELGESHAHTCGEFFTFMWQIWFTPNSTWSDLLKTLLNKHGLRINPWMRQFLFYFILFDSACS